MLTIWCVLLNIIYSVGAVTVTLLLLFNYYRSQGALHYNRGHWWSKLVIVMIIGGRSVVVAGGRWWSLVVAGGGRQ